MKSSLKNGRSVAAYRLVTFTTLLLCVAALVVPLLTRAQTGASITVVNNSNLEIRHVYLSPTDQDNWGADQLNGQTIATGQSATISSADCSGGQIKVISEDINGCFLYQVVSCSGNVTWTITNNDAPDCGY